ncbi:helix-turn-helix domain-containing protein [Streptomyces odontomachi]|uniref:helix-turn-helix domain-containing protein n=1 Tax=Streptomyces odontomachi TaxID=2944940 RepID=UPI00210D83FE|nr:helix-turn-helix transcriptional regulator [Streptomyces sp. ODS25]
MRCPEDRWELALGQPHPSLGPGVLRYRGFRYAPGLVHRHWEIPCGLTTLVLGFGAALRISPVSAPHRARTVVSLLSPPNTCPVLGEHTGGIHGVEVVFAPWAAFELFGVALDELPNLGAEPAGVLGIRIQHLSEQLAQAPGWPSRFAILDQFLLRCRREGRLASERVVAAWQRLEESRGRVEITALAESMQWSQRQLERKFNEQVGLTPKRLARVLRMQHAAALISAGRRPSEAASVCGFYDQAHLTREFTALTGHPPLRFISEYQSGKGSVDRAAGRITSILQEG